MNKMPLPKMPLSRWIDNGLDYLTDNYSYITKAISDNVEEGINWFADKILFFPPWVIIIVLALLAWWISGRKVGLFTLLGLTLIWNLGLWKVTVSTMSLVLAATGVAVGFGIPLGILAALKKGFHKVIMPVLDFMQTMPAFVYLIPAIPFFGLGIVSAMFATVIFAMPPSIRLTSLGIRQVPEDLIEAADAFGSTSFQKLLKIQLPLAAPTIMTGVNQTIMLSLSMVVIAAMIGAAGLGGEVLRAIQRFQPGKGFEAGIGVVILAIILDRITQRVGRKEK